MIMMQNRIKNLFIVYFLQIFNKLFFFKQFALQFWFEIKSSKFLNKFKGILRRKENTMHIFFDLRKKKIGPFFKYMKKFLLIENNQLIDIIAIDNSKLKKNNKKDPEIELIYSFLNVFNNKRIFINLIVFRKAKLESLTSIYESANWLEREVYEFFGIFFTGHPDLRKLLLDYGFKGYPGFKDFPKVGFIEMRYDDIKKSVVVEPTELSQEFRQFNLSLRW